METFFFLFCQQGVIFVCTTFSCNLTTVYTPPSDLQLPFKCKENELCGVAPQELLPVYTVKLLWTVLSNVLPVNSSSVLLFHTDADKTKEDSFKFFYVTKGPSKAQGKKLFYVYGQGWTAKDSMQVKPTQTLEEGSDFAWPSRHGPNDLVYQIKIISSSE